MEYTKKTPSEAENDILFSRTVKAGQRIYYVDVKKNRRDEMYLSITESKKMVSGPQDMPQVNYEKHKIFVFQEDFKKMLESLNEAMDFVQSRQEGQGTRPELEDEIKIDMEF